jgi:hypothetical protein
VLFVPGYFAMIAASILGYALRARGDVVTAIASGARAGLRGEQGKPPAWVLARARRGGEAAEGAGSVGLGA